MLLHLLVDRPEGAAHQYSVNSTNSGILFWNIHTLHGAFVSANLVLFPTNMGNLTMTSWPTHPFSASTHKCNSFHSEFAARYWHALIEQQAKSCGGFAILDGGVLVLLDQELFPPFKVGVSRFFNSIRIIKCPSLYQSTTTEPKQKDQLSVSQVCIQVSTNN